MNGNVIPDMGPLWKGHLISKGVENHCSVRNFLKMQWPHPFPMGTHEQSSGLICGDTSCGYLEVWRKMGNFLKKGGRAALCDRASMVMIFETFLDAPSFSAISGILCTENTFHVYEISLTQRLRLQQGNIKSVCLSVCPFSPCLVSSVFSPSQKPQTHAQRYTHPCIPFNDFVLKLGDQSF